MYCNLIKQTNVYLHLLSLLGRHVNALFHQIFDFLHFWAFHDTVVSAAGPSIKMSSSKAFLLWPIQQGVLQEYQKYPKPYAKPMNTQSEGTQLEPLHFFLKRLIC